MKEITVTNESAGQRLDKFLKRLLPSCPGSLLYKQLRKKNITLNGNKADGHELLSAGDIVSVFFSDETYEKFSVGEKTDISRYIKAFEEFGKIDTVYSDNDILIFNKPAGILSQSDASGDLSINDYLLGYLLKSGDISADGLSSFRPSICTGWTVILQDSFSVQDLFRVHVFLIRSFRKEKPKSITLQL